MWTVTRQSQWPDGDQVVEISSGGIDYCNPDALCKRYPGEFEEFDNPQEAVEAGIRIAQQWRDDCPELTILIGSGATGGDTMPFDGLPLTIQTYNKLRHSAKKCYEELPKCDRCGDILPSNENDQFRLIDCCEDERFCSENCANMAYEFYCAEMAELDAELEEVED